MSERTKTAVWGLLWFWRGLVSSKKITLVISLLWLRDKFLKKNFKKSLCYKQEVWGFKDVAIYKEFIFYRTSKGMTHPSLIYSASDWLTPTFLP